MTTRFSRVGSALLLVGAVAISAPAASAQTPTEAKLQRQLNALVAADGGPPGAIVTLRRGERMQVLSAGVADVTKRRSPRASDHMRIASVAKAFSGAVALRLVADGKLSLDDTIGGLLPSLPRAWSAVTVRQMLNHTSGLPDYTQSKGFAQQFEDNPGGFVSPRKIISWVRRDKLVFTPGSRYEYSNTDNIVVGQMAEQVTGTPYGRLLEEIVFTPLGLSETSFPIRPPLPRPFIHGYVVDPRGQAQDVSTLLSPSGAWASGGIVSTPRDLNEFIGAYLAGRLFPASLQDEQLRFVPGGKSSPPGPGRNAAGLAVFRYRTKCGTVFGHTGNFPGYVQFAAASRDGSRALTTSLNIPAPTGRLLARLRAMQQTAVCALLRQSDASAGRAHAARAKSCDGIGDTITRLRAKGLPCDRARTLSAKYAETAATGGGRVVRIDGFRCVRSNPPGPGRAARCAKRDGAVVVTFRYRLL